MEYIIAESDRVIGIKRRELLFLPDGKLPDDVTLENILQFSQVNGMKKVLADIPETEKLPEEYEHLGIIEFPVPILKGNVEVIKSIREKLYEPEFSDLTVVDFSDLAQGCKTYDEFIGKMKDVSETELNYYGIAICGAKKKVNKLTGSMALLR